MCGKAHHKRRSIHFVDQHQYRRMADSNLQIDDYREEFVSRLRGEVPATTRDTPLERRLSAIRQGLLAGDAEQGNGGAEVLQTVIDFCFHPDPPREEFGSVRDYLDYRWGDAAIR